MINIFLYTDNPSKSFDINQLISFLDNFNFNAENRGDIFDYLQLDEKDLCDFKDYIETIEIKNIEKPLDSFNQNDISTGLKVNTKRNFLDGYWLQRKLFSYLFKNQGIDFSDKNLHLIITGRLFGTFETKRYHARVLLTGEPALISTSGIVEAPARPREYYFVKANLLSIGKEIDGLDEIYKDRFVDYGDARMTNILCSYTLQQIKNKINGEPFCENTGCCLYNSHWQEELLNLQYKTDLCDKCRLIINNA